MLRLATRFKVTPGDLSNMVFCVPGVQVLTQVKGHCARKEEANGPNINQRLRVREDLSDWSEEGGKEEKGGGIRVCCSWEGHNSDYTNVTNVV